MAAEQAEDAVKAKSTARKKDTGTATGAARAGDGKKGAPTRKNPAKGRARPQQKGRGKSGNPAAPPKRQVRPARFSDWVGAMRIPTLPMSIAPVLVGTGAARLAGEPGEFHWIRMLLCFAVAIALQIGVNFANDYSDGIRGTDEYRVGPGRLVGSGRAKPRAVLAVALVFFGIAAVAGVLLTIATQAWWLLAIGAAAILAAWFYTGGKRPYGYYALGEVFVFIFFGLVATLGTMWVQVKTFTDWGLYGAIGVGCIAMAAILVNNLRDRATDRLARKHTLAVLLGNVGTRILFIVLMLVPFGILAVIALIIPAAWYGMFALVAALPACLITATARTARELVLVLRLVGVTQLLYGIALFLAYSLVG